MGSWVVRSSGALGKKGRGWIGRRSRDRRSNKTPEVTQPYAEAAGNSAGGVQEAGTRYTSLTSTGYRCPMDGGGRPPHTFSASAVHEAVYNDESVEEGCCTKGSGDWRGRVRRVSLGRSPDGRRRSRNRFVGQ